MQVMMVEVAPILHGMMAQDTNLGMICKMIQLMNTDKKVNGGWKKMTGLESVWKTGLIASLFLMLPQLVTASEIKVAVSIRPIHSLVQQVLGEVGQAELMMTGGSSPHGGALRPSERQALARADLVFIIDPSFESAYSKVLPPEERLVVLSASPGITLLGKRIDVTFDHDNQGHDDHDDYDNNEHDDHDNHGHDDHDDYEHDDHDNHGQDDHDNHGHDDHDDQRHDDQGHKGHNHEHDGLVDLHLWLNPDNAKAMIMVIRDRLQARYPEHAVAFAANADMALKALDQLDQELSAVLRPVQGRGFITHHDAYAYFEKKYDMRSLASIFDHDGQATDISRLRTLRNAVHHGEVICIFHEPQYNKDVLSVLDPDGILRSHEIDPLSADIPAGGGFYAAMMRRLAQDFHDCLMP